MPTQLVADDDPLDEATLWIRRYVDAHRHASDSVEGVQRWWLGGQGIEIADETVQRALDLLVDSGELASRQLGDGTVVYFATIRADQ
ncbi:MAG: hypothetical protein E6G67_08755 [Actinobacteria bacterium]|nr:MAG: hypothetical protein E6G67_08755 [Actinomycetota bacterium]